MMSGSLQDQWPPSLAAPFNPVLRCQPGVKIVLKGVNAEHFALSFTELWGLSVG